ncbi:MAG: aminomethyl-transferring glycine dehydrogenase subunit GcvPA [Acidobacteriaceae bacterium]|nr:aminomethyl-transferring glycine dehydrogenase subunit GcvPA [Acidobacteriaceae bacterium]
MRYLPKSDAERREMLAAIGFKSQDDLISDIPSEIRFDKPLPIEDGKSEYDIVEYFKQRGSRSALGYSSFLGAGVYNHYRPVIVDTVVSRGEFLTSYTPYQAEISQGTLTSIFEFQTMVCQLTGMDVANASMYDGSSAVPEAALMAVRVTRRDKVLVARTVHPEYREVLRTCTQHQGMPVEEIGYAKNGRIDLNDLRSKLDDTIAAVIVQTPNFFGLLEQIKELSHMVRAKGALLVVVFTEAVALGLIEPPAEADIVVGELQSFAISPSYGGPYAGIIAAREKYIRQLPGRLAGETTDVDGHRAFCLTLATREQHIRREKATSNICTNQALLALMATVFMSLYGKEGLRELAKQNLSKAHYLASKLPLRFEGPFFNEFVAQTNGKSLDAINRELLERKIVGGLPLGRFYPELGNCMLLCATEMNKRQDMDLVAGAF